jgi:DNA transformation protein and related proteins
MPVSSDFVDYVIEQLRLLGRVSARRMFGGVGLYFDGLFFGLIDDDTLYLRVDDSNRGEFVRLGSKPFVPVRDKPDVSMSYFDVPADLLDDSEELSRWARKSVGVALVAATEKARRAARPGKKRSSKTATRAKPK